nr:YidC/Oxa1 family membrane protein insertase [Nocardioides mesophilus]
MPIFLALFRLINQAANGNIRGVLTQDQVDSLSQATWFGAQIADRFTGTDVDVAVRILAAFLVVAMTATTFLTQRQLMSKNMPADAMTGPYAQQQKMLLYILPLVFAVGGIAFPIGVLIYWTTSNLWTMGQQFYVIRNNPAPNTAAFRAKEERVARKAQRKGIAPRPPRPEGPPERPRPRRAPGRPVRPSPRHQRGSSPRSRPAASARRRPPRRASRAARSPATARRAATSRSPDPPRAEPLARRASSRARRDRVAPEREHPAGQAAAPELPNGSP